MTKQPKNSQPTLKPRAAGSKPIGPGPIDPGTLDPTTPYQSLDPALPLVLLPVRIEARFSAPSEPPELRLRIYPDGIHADGHQSALTATEQKLGRAFWERSWRAGGDAAGKDAAFAWLAGQLGPWRAAWVARALTPTNQRQAPTATVPDQQPLRPAPRFPAVETLDTGSPSLARLLPLRWAAVAYRGDDSFGPWFGAPIPPDLAMAPGLVDVEGELDGRGLLDAQGLRWLYDFDEAVRVGMALRIDLTGLGANTPFSELLVFGIQSGDQREAVEALFTAHRYTDGLDLIPQGKPTNATETAAATLHPDRPDLAVLRAAELDQGSAPDRPTVAADDMGALYRMAGADAASVALGLGKGNALDRTSSANLQELAHAEAMNQALWPATLGYYFDHILQGALDNEGRSWLRNWNTSFVRGGGMLPTLLVGAQPYGLLPVTLVEDHSEPSSNVEYLETILDGLWSHWNDSFSGIPHLDPNLTDTSPVGETEGDYAATMSQVLGSVPHATSLRLRAVEAKRDDYTEHYNIRLDVIGELCELFPDANGEPYGDDDSNWALSEYERMVEELKSVGSTTSQFLALRNTTETFLTTGGTPDGLFKDHQTAHLKLIGDLMQTSLVDFVGKHKARVEPVMVSEFSDIVPSSITGLMGDDNDPEAFFAYHGDAGTEANWTAPLVAGGRTDADLAELRAWLAEMKDNLAQNAGKVNDYTKEFPLLRQLLRWSVEQATDPEDQTLLKTGLDRLNTVANDMADPVSELERLLRESLGPCSYRLDAWYTAVAACRLENKRTTKARGIQVGAYGFVVDLRRRADRRASQGYVLAPSLSHATTAAILRSGWSAFGGTAETAGLNVNLSSERIRRATWLIDGVRRGQDLAELLGSRLERRLHDVGLAAWVEPLRQLALTAVADPAPPNRIVDGLLLARARSGADDLSTTEEALRAAIDALLALQPPARPRGDPAPILAELVHDLDAAADAALAQSVFSLAEGNLPEATATLTAASSGEIEFPQMHFAETPRESLTVTHRLLLLLDPAATGGWPGSRSSGRALAAPALEAWVAGLLGDPATLRFSVRFVAPVSRATVAGPFTRSLADVGLAALDFTFLAPVGEEPGLGQLGALLIAWAETLRPATTPPTAVAVIQTNLGEQRVDDLALAARSLRRLIAAARDLDGRDLATPGATDATSGFATAELGERVNAVNRALRAQRNTLAAALPLAAGEAARGDVRAAMLALSGFQFSGGTPRALAATGLIAEGVTLLGQIDGRLAAYQARVSAETPGWDELDELGRRDALVGRLHLLVGQSYPLAPRFTAVNGDMLDASFARGRLGSREAATQWLAAVGRVDPGAWRLRVAIDLIEAVADQTLFTFSLGQLPDYPAEGWAAIMGPTADQRGRLCLLTTGAVPHFAGRAAAGLVLGAWSEPVLRGRQTAGVALHFDAPSARPPQALLLCTADSATGFDFELVRDMIKQTLDLSRLRMVGPETLHDLGQFLPMVYLPGTISPGATT